MAPLGRLRELKLVIDFAVLSGGQLLSKFAGFAAFAYLARVLGPSDYGLVEYALGLQVFFAMTIELGLGPIGAREIATGERTAEDLAANIPLARLAIVLVSIPVMMLVPVVSRATTDVAYLWPYALALLSCPWKLEWLFQAREMMTAAAAGQLIRMGLFAGGIFLLVNKAGSFGLVGWIELASAALTTFYYLALQHGVITPVSLKEASPTKVVALLKEGLSVGSSQVASAVNIYAPLLLVASLAGGEETGWFSAAHRVIASLLTFSQLYHFNLYPVLARRLSGDATQVDEIVGASVRVIGWASIGGALVLTLLGTQLMKLMFGSAFVAGARTFEWLAWFLPVTLLNGHARWLLIAARKQEYVLYAQIAGIVASAASGIPLVLFFQSEGAAVSMVIGALAVWLVAHVAVCAKVRVVPGLGSVVLPGALAAAAIAIVPRFGSRPLTAAFVATALFAGLAPLLDRRLFGDLKVLAAAKADVGGAA